MYSKSLFIAEMKEDLSVIDYFQVAAASVRQTKRGSDYMSITLRDNSGELEAKMWDIPDGFTTSVGDFVKVKGHTELYRGALQFNIALIRVVPADEIFIGDYIPHTPYDIEEMWGRLTELVQHTGGTIHAALSTLLNAHQDEIRSSPAAKGIHQPYIGGLLEHTLAIAELARAVCDVYEELGREPLSYNVLIAAAIVHDIGKIYELECQPLVGYTLVGSVIGHIVQGYELWAKFDKDIEEPDRTHIRHILLSHHGKREWGSPIVPMTREAVLFHQLDMIDSRMAAMDVLDKSQLDAKNLTQWDRAFETQIWRPHGKKEKSQSGCEVPEGTRQQGSEEGTERECESPSGDNGANIPTARDSADPTTSGIGD